jgi:hypothetical protein
MMNICSPGKKLYVCTVLALGLGSSNAVAAWFEDFETHVVDAKLQTNPVWDGGGNLMYSRSFGPQYGDSTLIGMRKLFKYGHAYRSTFGGAATGTTLSARLNASTLGLARNAFIKIGLGDGNETMGHLSFNFPDLMAADHVWMGLEHFVDPNDTESIVLTAQGTDYTTYGQSGHTSNGSSVVLSENACCLLEQSWYDVRLTQTDPLSYLPEYRLSAAGDVGAWTALDIVTAGADFVPTYVGIRASNRGAIDDIAWTPASALADADFDEDGDIDGSDFLSWQRGFGVGSTLAEGDANGDMIVDDADLAIWETQYGTTPLVSATTAVPEPATAFLLGLGISLWMFRCRELPSCRRVADAA